MTLACSSNQQAKGDLIAHSLDMKYPKRIHKIITRQVIAVSALSRFREVIIVA